MESELGSERGSPSAASRSFSFAASSVAGGRLSSLSSDVDGEEEEDDPFAD